MNEELRILVEKSMKGDKGAFEKLIKIKQRDILYITSRYCSPQDVEDYAQEALILMLKNVSHLKDPNRFNDWMYSVIKNTCYYCNRRKKDRSKIAEITLFDPLSTEVLGDIQEDREEFLPAAFVENEEKRKLVMAELNTLPENYRECLFLFYYEEMSYVEIAQVMKTTTNHVGTNLLRAKKMLKEKLSQAVKQHAIFSISGVSAIPVLTQIFRADAQANIPQEMCDRVLESTLAAFGKIGTTAGAGAVSGSGPFAVSKSAVAIVSALVITGAGIGSVFLVKSNQTVPEATPVTAGSETANKMADTLARAKDHTFAIESPSDMIGEDYMAKLKEYAEHGVSKKEWNQFLLDIGAEEKNQAANSRQDVYRMNVRQQQDKQLVLISREQKGQERLTVKYQFESAGELPDMMQIVLAF